MHTTIYDAQGRPFITDASGNVIGTYDAQGRPFLINAGGNSIGNGNGSGSGPVREQVQPQRRRPGMRSRIISIEDVTEEEDRKAEERKAAREQRRAAREASRRADDSDETMN